MGPRCALSVEELICDLVVEPQPIDRVRSADAACRACWLLDSRAVRWVGSTSADLDGDRRCSGERLAPSLEPHCAAVVPVAHRRLRMDCRVNRQQDDEQTCWWGLGCRLLLAGRRSAERRRRRRPRARLARRGSDDAAGRCCAMAAQRSGSGRQARVWTSLCAQRLQGSAWVSGPAADRVGPAADATGGVHVRPCVFLGVMYNPKGATSPVGNI